jgi:F-type H+-transporting ATPase subunit b
MAHMVTMAQVVDTIRSTAARTAGGGGEEMPNVLAVPVDELIIGLIAFFIVFGALSKFALPNIRKTLAARTEAIEGGLAKAEQAQAEANAALEEYKAQLAQAREEAAAIRTQAQADRASMIEEAKTEARAAAQQVTAAAEAQVAADRTQATAALTRQVGELAVQLAGKVVGQSMTDDARIRKTVDDFLDELERQAAR